MKEHSFLCRTRFEANKEMKDVDNKIGDIIFDAYMKGKELETSLRIDQYKTHSFFHLFYLVKITPNLRTETKEVEQALQRSKPMRNMLTKT